MSPDEEKLFKFFCECAEKWKSIYETAVKKNWAPESIRAFKREWHSAVAVINKHWPLVPTSLDEYYHGPRLPKYAIDHIHREFKDHDRQ